MATISDPQPFVLKDVELLFANDDYRFHVSAVTMTPTTNVIQWRGLSPTALHTDTALSTWSVTIELAQDWTTEGSLARYLFMNEGKRVDVQFRPLRSAGAAFKGTVVVVPGSIGGTVDSIAIQSVTLPLTGRPSIVTSTTFDTGSGWAVEYTGGTSVHDKNMKHSGTGSIKMTLATDAVASGMSTPIAPLDFSRRTFKLYMRSDNWSAVDGVRLEVYNDPGAGWDGFTYNLKQYQIDLVNNEWYEIQIPKQFWNRFGNGTWDQPIAKIAVMAYPHIGQTANVWVNEIQAFPTFRQRGAVAITFDDAWLTSYTEGASAMRARGMAGSFYIIPNLLGQAGRMTQAQVDELHASGFDIGGHSEFNLVPMTESARDADLASVKAYLDSRGYRGRDIYAYPEGQNNNAVRRDVAQKFKTARTTNFANQPTGYIAPYRINSYSPLAGDELSRLKGYVDAAEASGDLAVFCFHGIVANPVEPIDYSKADFTALLDYILTKDVDVLPLSAFVE